MNKNKLPNKPSKLIRVALKDLELVEQDNNYSIYMGDWHMPLGDKCSVCLAGSVIARTLNTPLDAEVDPLDFNLITKNKLLALNQFRVGYIGQGLHFLDIEQPKNTKTFVYIPHYDENPILFKERLSQMADSFEMRGL